MRWMLLAGTLGITGCAYQTSSYENGEGSVVCITTEQLSNRIGDDYSGTVTPMEETFEEDEKAWVNVVFHHALGKDCDRIESASCTVSYDGNKAVIQAEAEWKFRRDRAQCDGPIEPMVASCQTVSLDADTWTFQYGEMDLVVEVPSTVETPCLDIDPAAGCSSMGAQVPAIGWLLLTPALLLRRRSTVVA